MRKKQLMVTLVLGVSCMMGACSGAPPTEPDVQRARETLIQFFDLLAAGGYQDAAALYGGTYDTLIGWNPVVDPGDHASLWQNGCQLNGLQCLSVRSAPFVGRAEDIFEFEVEFSNPDGSLFVRGPCCGADETQMPPESRFSFRVQKTPDGDFLVLDMPVYVP